MTRLRYGWLVIATTVICLAGGGDALRAQSSDVAAIPEGLKRRVEDTWRVVPLQNGLLLVPRRASTRVKGIELSDATIAIDGRVVSGAELVSRLGADAEAVLQLSYLASDQRTVLFAEPENPPVERPRDVTPSAPRPEPLDVEHEVRREFRGARVRVFGPVAVSEGERVGDVVAVFGSVDLRGEATGDVVAVFGDVVMGPKATIGGNVVAIGGTLRAADGATTTGKLTEVRVGWPEMRLTIPGDDQFSVQVTPDWPRIARVQWVSGFVGAGLLFAVCVFTVLVAPGAVSAVANSRRSLFLSGLAGMAIEVLLLPTTVLIASALTLSVIGIPLLAAIPVLLLLVAAAAIVGFTAIAARAGSVWRPGGRVSASMMAVVIGLALIWATSLTGRYLWAASGGHSTFGAVLAVVGFAIEYTCWTIGLGNAVLTWLGRRAARTVETPVIAPPPVPVDL